MITLLITEERVASKVGKVSNKLVVHNVAFEATKKELTELFGAYGQLKTVRLPVKKFGGSHRG